jgi:hypothetical protein
MASAAPTRFWITRITSTIRVVSPTLARTSSPGDTVVGGGGGGAAGPPPPPPRGQPAMMCSAALKAVATVVSVGLLAEPRGISPLPPR